MLKRIAGIRGKSGHQNIDRVLVSVRDRGVGLRENLNRIFEPFYTTKRNGLGMGLSISRSIIEAHGGQVWARNHPDGGVSFLFTVPIEGVGRSA